MPLDKSEFNSFSLAAKSFLAFNDACFIDAIFHSDQWINLYSINDFFVEVYFEEDSSEALVVNALGEHELHKYLACINLSDLPI